MPPKHCPECFKKGKKMLLKSYLLTNTTAIILCSNVECMYWPFGSKVFAKDEALAFITGQNFNRMYNDISINIANVIYSDESVLCDLSLNDFNEKGERSVFSPTKLSNGYRSNNVQNSLMSEHKDNFFENNFTDFFVDEFPVDFGEFSSLNSEVKDSKQSYEPEKKEIIFVTEKKSTLFEISNTHNSTIESEMNNLSSKTFNLKESTKISYDTKKKENVVVKKNKSNKNVNISNTNGYSAGSDIIDIKKEKSPILSRKKKRLVPIKSFDFDEIKKSMDLKKLLKNKCNGTEIKNEIRSESNVANGIVKNKISPENNVSNAIVKNEKSSEIQLIDTIVKSGILPEKRVIDKIVNKKIPLEKIVNEEIISSPKCKIVKIESLDEQTRFKVSKKIDPNNHYNKKTVNLVSKNDVEEDKERAVPNVDIIIPNKIEEKSEEYFDIDKFINEHAVNLTSNVCIDFGDDDPDILQIDFTEDDLLGEMN